MASVGFFPAKSYHTHLLYTYFCVVLQLFDPFTGNVTILQPPKGLRVFKVRNANSLLKLYLRALVFTVSMGILFTMSKVVGSHRKKL